MTQVHYNTNAKNLVRTYADSRNVISEWLETAFPQGGKIFDVRIGSGQVLNRLLDSGMNAHGVESCRAFIEDAEMLYAKAQIRVTESRLPDLLGIADQEYDGLLCPAALLHLYPRRNGKVESLKSVPEVLPMQANWG